MTFSTTAHQKISTIKWVSGQAFAHYADWECYQANYWNGGSCQHDRSPKSAEVLTQRFSLALETLVLTWPTTCAVHLTNTGINRRAWLGQAACFIETGNCIECTVQAWFSMTECEQSTANKTANELIERWLKVNSRKENCRRQNAQLEFPF